MKYAILVELLSNKAKGFLVFDEKETASHWLEELKNANSVNSKVAFRQCRKQIFGEHFPLPNRNVKEIEFNLNCFTKNKSVNCDAIILNNDFQVSVDDIKNDKQ